MPEPDPDKENPLSDPIHLRIVFDADSASQLQSLRHHLSENLIEISSATDTALDVIGTQDALQKALDIEITGTRDQLQVSQKGGLEAAANPTKPIIYAPRKPTFF